MSSQLCTKDASPIERTPQGECIRDYSVHGTHPQRESGWSSDRPSRSIKTLSRRGPEREQKSEDVGRRISRPRLEQTNPCVLRPTDNNKQALKQ